MEKYKVLIATTIDGAEHAVDTVVELTEEVAAPLVAEGRLELVPADQGASQGNTAADAGADNADVGADADAGGAEA